MNDSLFVSLDRLLLEFGRYKEKINKNKEIKNYLYYHLTF